MCVHTCVHYYHFCDLLTIILNNMSSPVLTEKIIWLQFHSYLDADVGADVNSTEVSGQKTGLWWL
ncbi:hypothetical protein EXN66_Car019661 [Channa argus]|uniref:Uncharacterized protein n=1 Tax=Channa argus TaxID=215402 RepID=A0A6G1QNV5_CHAAH|nr:hypothetical protein EXN66_Car019661 [Channa argus]